MHVPVFLLFLCGHAWATGNWHFWFDDAESHIVSMQTYLTLPAAPAPMMTDLSLWPGVPTASEILVQTFAMSAADQRGESAAPCAGAPWCIAASHYDPHDTHWKQTVAAYRPARPGETVMVDYRYDAATGNITQWAVMDGATVSYLSSHSGPGRYFGFSVESTGARQTGTSPAHVWRNTTIRLAQPEPGYNAQSIRGTTYTEPTTPDGGLTWHVEEVSIGPHSFA